MKIEDLKEQNTNESIAMTAVMAGTTSAIVAKLIIITEKAISKFLRKRDIRQFLENNYPYDLRRLLEIKENLPKTDDIEQFQTLFDDYKLTAKSIIKDIRSKHEIDQDSTGRNVIIELESNINKIERKLHQIRK